MQCSGSCYVCGNRYGCVAGKDEDLFYYASIPELERRLSCAIAKNEKEEIQKAIDYCALQEQLKQYATEFISKNPDFCREKILAKRIRFMLNGCDISFVAEAPEDITLKQLLKQCDRIEPDWCDCGIRSLTEDEENGDDRFGPLPTEIIIDYNDIQKVKPNVSCTIKELNDK